MNLELLKAVSDDLHANQAPADMRYQLDNEISGLIWLEQKDPTKQPQWLQDLMKEPA